MRLPQFWDKRTAGERRLILAGAALTVAVFFYAYLWQPISEERQRLRKTLPELRGVAVQMREQASEAVRLKAELTGASQGRITPAAIEQAVEAAALPRQERQVTVLGEDRVRIDLAMVPFEAWIGLLKSLLSEPFVQIESVVIAATGASGLVNVQAVILLSNPGSRAKALPPRSK